MLSNTNQRDSLGDATIELIFLYTCALDNSSVPRFHIHSLLVACVDKGKLPYLIDNYILHTLTWSSIKTQKGKDIADRSKACESLLVSLNPNNF